MKAVEGQVSLFDPDLPCGKTYQVLSVATKAKISEPSLKRLRPSVKTTYQFLDLRDGILRGGMAGHGWSVAWRTYDAQYWGVPQRRKRIYLVADFGSERAIEILSECKGLCWDSTPCGTPWQRTPADAERSVGRSGGVRCLNPWDSQSIRQYDVNGVAPSLNANSSGGQNRFGVCYENVGAFMGGQGAKARSIAYCDDGSTPTLKSAPSGGNTVPDVVYALQGNGIDRADTAGCNGKGWREDAMYTLDTVDRPAVVFQQNQREEVRDMGEQAGAITAQPGVHNQNYVVYPDKARTLAARHDSSPCVDRGQNVVCVQNTGRGWWNESDTAATLRTPCGGDSTKANLVVYGVDCRNATLDEEKTHTVQAKANGGISLNCTPSVCYRNSGYGDMVEGVGTLRANGGDAGGEPKASLLNVFDARGNGDGDTAPCVTGDHNGHISDYTAVLVEKHE